MKRLLVLCWLVPSVAFAQTLAEGEALYGDGELVAALKTADAALKRSTESVEVSKLQVLRGLVLLAQGKKDKARSAFVFALQADADARLDPQRVPPAAIALFDQAREGVPPGTVSVSTASADATLRIDGTDFGPLPLTTKIAIGRHVLEATGRDGVLRAEVLVKSGETQSVVLSAPVVQPPPERVEAPPLVPSEPPSVSATSASLLDETAQPVKRTWWGLIPISLAFAGGWIVPPLLLNPSLLWIGLAGGTLSMGAIALGVGLIVGSGLDVARSEGKTPVMTWSGLIPLGIGLLGLIIGTAFNPAVAGYVPINAVTSIVGYAVGLVGVGVGTGMLVGQALGVAAATPRVSFFALPEGGGLSVTGRF